MAKITPPIVHKRDVFNLYVVEGFSNTHRCFILIKNNTHVSYYFVVVQENNEKCEFSVLKYQNRVMVLIGQALNSEVRKTF